MEISASQPTLQFGVGPEATESFRWAMYKSPHGYGLNAQTMAKYLRYFVTAPKGRVICAGDLSQAEARVVAYESNCRDLIEIFSDPRRNVHLENALVVFGHAVEKDTPEYTLAKAGIHASNYREGAKQFATQNGLPLALAKQILANILRARSEVPAWHDRVWRDIKQTGKLSTCLGDERTFYEAISTFALLGRMTDQQWKDAISWVPQSTVPHVLNLGLVEFAKARAQGMDLWFHHQGHDSYAVSVPDDGLCQREFQELSQSAFAAISLTALGRKYQIPMEAGAGYNLGENMPWDGTPLTRASWEHWRDAKLVKQPRADQIRQGIYGVHLRGWRA